jgi:hypothetical protein
MSEQKIYPKGITFFEPRQGAPNWVKGSVIIAPRELFDWIKANPSVLTEHEKYGKQLKLTVTEKGMQVDTWQPTAGKQAAPQQQKKDDSLDLPF